jgi:hypothetical protein
VSTALGTSLDELFLTGYLIFVWFLGARQERADKIAGSALQQMSVGP